MKKIIGYAAEAGKYDFLLNTASATIDLSPYFNLLKHNGQLTQVGLPTEPLPVSMFPVVFKRLNPSGSFIGGIQETQEMIEFCTKIASLQTSKKSAQKKSILH